MKRVLLFLLVPFGLATSCYGPPKELSPDKYVKWVEQPDHGYIKDRKVNGVTVKVQYLPSQYLAYKEFIRSSQNNSYDSIWEAYKCAIAFMITLSADKNDPSYGNLMYFQITSREDFNERVRTLSFKAEEFISISIGDVVYSPVLTHFEGFDQHENKLSFQVSFVVPEYQCGKFESAFNGGTIIFDDPYWNLGTLQFQFEAGVMSNLPSLLL